MKMTNPGAGDSPITIKRQDNSSPQSPTFKINVKIEGGREGGESPNSQTGKGSI